MGPVGIEPTTLGLRVPCSNLAELRSCESAGRDSNSRPSEWQSDALPTELPTRYWDGGTRTLGLHLIRVAL
jgi:hypothetical protein